MGLRSAHKVKSLTWWRGPIAVLFGLPALWSGTFLTTQVLVLGLFAIAEGMSALIGGLLARSGRGLGWPLALRAMATIPIAVLVCVRPSAAGPALLSAIVAWVMFTGTLD
ncbi:MAG: hypothetical protein JXC32_22245, partial [Anaerolineae bacterium]|nr:hypothetical protein [Anaerolineae bacterium]